METRKVQLSGGTTYTVSLPKTWAQEHGIEAGSSLSLYPNNDGSLLVEVDGDRSSRTRSARVDIATDSDDAVGQWIHALHGVGFDEVTLLDRTGHAPERRDTIEKTVATLSGFELLEVGDTRIRLTNLIDAENVDVRKSTLRLRLVMLGMHRDAVTAVVSGDDQLAQRVIDRDSEADKLFAMVVRHFRRALTDLHEVEKLEYSRDELFEFYYCCRQFERIADHAEKIARFTLDPGTAIPGPFDEEIESLGSASRQIVDSAADVVLADAGIAAAHRALEARDDLAIQLTALDQELYAHSDPGEAYVMGLILDSLRRTGEYGANVAGIAIQQVARTGESDE